MEDAKTEQGLGGSGGYAPETKTVYCGPRRLHAKRCDVLHPPFSVSFVDFFFEYPFGDRRLRAILHRDFMAQWAYHPLPKGVGDQLAQGKKGEPLKLFPPRCCQC